MMKFLLSICACLLFTTQLHASELYRVTLLRASPGIFMQMIDEVKTYRDSKQGNVSIMRHSQGDHWDLMLLEPAGEDPIETMNFSALADFQHSFLAKSDTKWDAIKIKSDVSGTYHIEMFHALHGKASELLKERVMENVYLAATQQTSNVIFETVLGSDVDSFTIGYHKNLAAFATTPDLPSETFEQAAIKAGFKNRADLSFYLRSLIVAHHDTLATSVD